MIRFTLDYVTHESDALTLKYGIRAFHIIETNVAHISFFLLDQICFTIWATFVLMIWDTFWFYITDDQIKWDTFQRTG